MQAKNVILDDVYRKGDSLMHGVAWGMWLYALAIVLIMNTSIAPVLLVGLPAAGLASLLWYSARGRLVARLGMAAVLMVLAAVQIQVARGMNEMHFGVFVLLAFLLYYRDWRPIVCAAGVIAVHHLVFDLMQARRLGVLVFEQRNGFNVVLLHALYVVFETAVLVLMAHLLRREAQASQAVVDLASEIARGRLNVQAGAGADGASTLVGPLREMQRQLGAMVEEIRAQAGSIAGFTRDLDSSAATLADTAERQSGDASSMASSIEQLTVSIGHLADRAQDAATVSRQSGELSRQGDAVIREASEEIGQISSTIQQTAFAIEQLGEQSQKISGIVHVIKEVAEQTNLLALNAAIEAARAGEQGRGFAVVADEVRKLAERTTHSTQEISGMVQSIQERTETAVQQMQLAVQRVNHGVQLTEQTGDAIRRIREGAEHTLSLIDEISGTLREQSSTSEDIARRVEGVAQGSQSSSRAAGVCADTAHRLHDLVDQMQTAIGRFEVR